MWNHTQPLILTYHSLSNGSSPLCTPPDLFAAQMEWLAGQGHRVLSLGELVGLLRNNQPLPPKTVVLTFDDGFRDFYTVALPVLTRWRLPATVFVVTSYCGRTNRWPGQPTWCEELPLMSWQEIQDAARAGIEVGSHSQTHPVLPELNGEALQREIAESRQELETRLGRPADSFCYPYGRWNDSVRKVVQEHMRVACDTTMAHIRPTSDLYRLPRLDAYYLRPHRVFRNLFSRSGALYLGLRAQLRALRSRIPS